MRLALIAAPVVASYSPDRSIDLADIELCVGASGHGPKRGDAEKEGAEGATQRPPI